MGKLINGEIYRILHKKGIYIYLFSLAIGYLLLALIRSGGFNQNSIVKEALDLFMFLPPLVGGYLFAAIYTDDLGARNLITLVGFGMKKTKIVVAKLVITALFCSVIFAIVPLFLYMVHALLGWTATASAMITVYTVVSKYLLMTLAYAALSGIAVYGLQRTTFAVVLYMLLAFNVIDGLSTLLFKSLLGPTLAPVATDRLISGIVDRIVSGITGSAPLTMPIIEYMVFVAIAVVLSLFAFKKKEMAF